MHVVTGEGSADTDGFADGTVIEKEPPGSTPTPSPQSLSY